MNNIFTFKLSNDNLGITPIDNIFINEYMPRSRGDYVKVYLYGLKIARSGMPEKIDNFNLAQLFDITEADVINAWEYWQNEGIIKIEYNEYHQMNIVFYHIPSMLIKGNNDTETDNTSQVEDRKDIFEMFGKIETLYGSRTLSKEDIITFKRWVNEDGFEPNTVVFLVQYTLEYISNKGKTFSGKQLLNYMSTIADKWKNAGISSVEDAQSYVKRSRENNNEIYHILKKLGLFRDPMEWEKEIILSWIDIFHYDQNIINLALQRTKKPDIKYINGILKNWHEKQLHTVEDVIKYEKINPHYLNNNVKVQDIDQNEYEALMSEDERWLMEQGKYE